MLEAIFLAADNCTPIATATTKESLMNLQERMALMKMKASLPATLLRNTQREEDIKRGKDKVPAAWRDFRGTTGAAKGRKKEKKKLSPWGSSPGPFLIAAESELNGAAGWKRKASGWRGIERCMFLMGS